MANLGYWCWSAAARGAASSGDLTFTTSHDVTCSGRFVYLTAEEARSTFDCGGNRGVPLELGR